MDSQIIMEKIGGFHNTSVHTIDRLDKAGTYKDLSTICIIPTRGMIPAKAVQSWWSMMTPMNQKFTRMFGIKMEVGESYNWMLDVILNNEELKNWKYILTLEEDNIVPPDGLMKLYESIEGGVDGNKYDVVGGLYWTKGEDGQPMIYGDPKVEPRNYIPQKPVADSVVPANGLGMGFNLFRLDMFKDERLTRPFFKTLQEFDRAKGVSMATQDMYFYDAAGKLGYKFACDCRVKIGHYDAVNDKIW